MCMIVLSLLCACMRYVPKFHEMAHIYIFNKVSDIDMSHRKAELAEFMGRASLREILTLGVSEIPTM